MSTILRILAPVVAVLAAQGVAAAADSAQKDCVRGEPEPVLVWSHESQKYSFEKLASETTERLTLDDKTALTVRNFGCAHYALEFTFLLTGERASDHQPKEWLARAAALLRRLEARPASEPLLSQAADRLQRAAVAPYEYRTPLSIPENTSVTLDVRSVADGTKLVVLYDVAL
jgi:hypothetical protein